MSDDGGGKDQLLRVVGEGARIRGATALLESEGGTLAASIRRAVPFLSRRGTPITVRSVRIISGAEVEAEQPRPSHYVGLACDPNASGALILDANAIAAFLDGVLGGDGQALPELTSETLTMTQAALVTRVTDGIIDALSAVLFARLGLRFRRIPDASLNDRGQTFVIATFELETALGFGCVHLALPLEALVDRRVTIVRQESDPDPRVKATLCQVELEVVAELGRRRMTVRELTRVKVGDIMRFDARVNAPVRIHASDTNGKELFCGRPTVQNGQIAVRIERHGG